MPDREKVIENLTHLKERLKWQKDIQGYGIYIDYINGAIALLKEQEEIIEQYHRADGFLAAHGWKWEGR